MQCLAIFSVPSRATNSVIDAVDASFVPCAPYIRKAHCQPSALEEYVDSDSLRKGRNMIKVTRSFSLYAEAARVGGNIATIGSNLNVS